MKLKNGISLQDLWVAYQFVRHKYDTFEKVKTIYPAVMAKTEINLIVLTDELEERIEDMWEKE